MEKTVAIITKDNGLNHLYTALTESLGHHAAAMDVGLGTAPQSIADFVKQANPDLVLLSENFGQVGISGRDRQGLEAVLSTGVSPVA